MNFSIGTGIALQLVLGLLFLRALVTHDTIQHCLLLLGGMALAYLLTLTLASIRKERQQAHDA